MSESKGPSSWTKNYDEVDFDLPLFQSRYHEGEAMLQSPKTLSTSTTPELQPLDSSSILPTLPRPAKHHSSYIHGPLTHEPSSSNSPPTLIDSATLRNPTPDLTYSSSGTGTFIPRSQRTTVSSIKSFAPSPLKPPGPTTVPLSPFHRSGSRGSTYINRIASEECRALASHHSLNHSGSRGSMILYRRADLATEEGLLPPSRSHLNRNSILSISADSIVSLSSDSKYPARTIASDRGLIAYAYDPSLDELSSATPADDDFLHDPDDKFPQPPGLFPAVSSRGLINVLTLVALVAAIVCLFVVYPVIRFYHDNGRNLLITFNARINATGQAEVVIVNRRDQILLAAPIPLIDLSTPLPSRILKTNQDITYELVFSDEFARNRRSLRTGIYSSSGILNVKVPLCLNRGGFVEVGLREKGSGFDWWSGLGSRSKRGVDKEGGEGTLRRLIYVCTLSTFPPHPSYLLLLPSHLLLLPFDSLS
ncbi:hypothetical protein BYT27DRAFT_7142866 [Phlegmacium glaucopus]|nr:hypothetical protein BYT27DRAFT_7142866 [Phlegmacium glaucopus]